MTEQERDFKNLNDLFSRRQRLIKQAYGIVANQTRCLNLYDILNSPKVEKHLKESKKDCPLLQAGKINPKVLEQRKDAAYEIVRLPCWQNHKEEDQFSGDIQTALNRGKKILDDPAQEEAYWRWLGLAPLPPINPPPIKPIPPLSPGNQEPQKPTESSSGSNDISANYIRRGISFLESGAYRAAIDKFDQAIRLQPDACEAFANRAQARYNLGENPQAKDDCNEAIRLDPNFAWVYVLRGKILHISKKPEEAIKDLNTAIQKLKEAIDRVNDEIKEADKAFDLSLAVELKARKLADLKLKLREAETELAKIKDSQAPTPIPPGSQTPPSDLGKSYSELLNQAKAFLDQAIAHHKSRKYQQAITACDQAIALQPKYTEAYYHRGLARYQLGSPGDYREALADYNKAIQLKPGFADAYYQRGLVYRCLESQNKAIADFREAANLYDRQSNQTMYRQAIALVKELDSNDPPLRKRRIRQSLTYTFVRFNRAFWKIVRLFWRIIKYSILLGLLLGGLQVLSNFLNTLFAAQSTSPTVTTPIPRKSTQRLSQTCIDEVDKKYWRENPGMAGRAIPEGNDAEKAKWRAIAAETTSCQ